MSRWDLALMSGRQTAFRVPGRYRCRSWISGNATAGRRGNRSPDLPGIVTHRRDVVESSRRLPLEILCGPSTNGALVAANDRGSPLPCTDEGSGQASGGHTATGFRRKGGFAQRSAGKNGLTQGQNPKKAKACCKLPRCGIARIPFPDQKENSWVSLRQDPTSLEKSRRRKPGSLDSIVETRPLALWVCRRFKSSK